MSLLRLYIQINHKCFQRFLKHLDAFRMKILSTLAFSLFDDFNRIIMRTFLSFSWILKLTCPLFTFQLFAVSNTFIYFETKYIYLSRFKTQTDKIGEKKGMGSTERASSSPVWSEKRKEILENHEKEFWFIWIEFSMLKTC